jgi:cysteine synthase A
MKFAESITDLIGGTPVVKLSRVAPEGGAELYAKLECFNPGASVKDRIALSMVEAAERDGTLQPGGTIVEPTSGNTGIGLAMVAAARGYKLILAMPESMSLERRKILSSLGAKIVLTPKEKGMKGAIAGAEAIMERTPGAFMPQQFDNPANPEVHERTTAREVIDVFGTSLDAFVAGVGTGGTITGAGRALKQEIPGISIVAVEPTESPVLSGGEPAPHMIQGIGGGFVPDIYDPSVVDRVMTASYGQAVTFARRLATEEGILVGISCGAAAHSAAELAREMGPGKNVLVLLPDTGERYLSTELFPEPECEGP